MPSLSTPACAGDAEEALASLMECVDDPAYIDSVEEMIGTKMDCNGKGSRAASCSLSF